MTTPRKPRKQRTSKPKLDHPNPFAEQLSNTRKAYSAEFRAKEATREAEAKDEQGSEEGRANNGERGTGAAICSPLPEPRTRGKLINASEYADAIPEQTVIAWATQYVTSRNGQRFLADLQPGIGRENQRWRADLVHALERHPAAIEAMSEVRSRLVLSDLQRRSKLRSIAESPEHELRGYSDHIKAIELDAKLDPESNLGRAKDSAQAVFQAPVNLFFCASTQAVRDATSPEPKAIDL